MPLDTHFGILDPRFLSQMAYYDVASSKCWATPWRWRRAAHSWSRPPWRAPPPRALHSFPFQLNLQGASNEMNREREQGQRGGCGECVPVHRYTISKQSGLGAKVTSGQALPSPPPPPPPARGAESPQPPSRALHSFSFQLSFSIFEVLRVRLGAVSRQ